MLVEWYFYHLIYIAKIQYCATLVMAEIKMFEIWLQEGKWTHDEHLEVTPIGNRWDVLPNSSWDENWKLVIAQRLFLVLIVIDCMVFSCCYLHIM